MTPFRCSKCSSRAIYFRRSDGLWLCASCLGKFLKKRVESYLRRRRDLTPQERILVVLAGGTKSLVNLDLICRVERVYPLVEVKAIIIREPVVIPPKINLVKVLRNIAGELGVEVVGEVDINCESNDVWRARLVACLDVVKAMGFTSVALGMTLDDRVVNLLYGLVTGRVTFPEYMINGIKVLTPLMSIFLKEVLIYGISMGFPVFYSGCLRDTNEKVITNFIYELEEEDPNVKFTLCGSLTKVLGLMGGRGASSEVDPHSR